MTPTSRSRQHAGAPSRGQGAASSPSVMKGVVGAWMEGARMLGRLMWFCLHLGFLLIPWQIAAVLITGKSDATVYANGHFDGRAAIAGVLLLMYLPVACFWASQSSGCFGKGGRLNR